MEIRKVETGKKRYLDLLLLADEQEDMVDRYLERGTMYVLEDDGVKAECVVTDEGNGVLELKNLAVEPDFQGRGYGKATFSSEPTRGSMRCCRWAPETAPPPFPFMRPAALAGTIWSKTFSPTTTTTPSTSVGCSWWTWCTCKESCEKRSAQGRSACRYVSLCERRFPCSPAGGGWTGCR